MITFKPVVVRMGQAATPAPAPAAAQAPVVVTSPPQTAPFVAILGWSVLGFAAGAATGYVVGKGLGHKGNTLVDGIIGGTGGLAAALLTKMI